MPILHAVSKEPSSTSPVHPAASPTGEGRTGDRLSPMQHIKEVWTAKQGQLIVTHYGITDMRENVTPCFTHTYPVPSAPSST